jgi:Zn-dependent protease with chaperone function
MPRTMDFFGQQDAARKKSAWLIFLFIIAVIVITLAIYFLFAITIAVSMEYAEKEGGMSSLSTVESPFNLSLFLLVSLGTLGIISAGSLYKMHQLRGGEVVAMLLGGRRIIYESANPAEKQLLNVVEEMAIASGTPVPPVYVLDDEKTINGFAAGYEPGDAVIGVTRGALEYLDRDELQGIIAHGFSYIINGDMRLNLKLMGVLHGILLIAIIGWYILRAGAVGGGRKDNNGGAILILGLALLIVGGLGVMFANLIKSAVSRQRVLLGDAAAVQFTRHQDSVIGVLFKTGGLTQTSKVRAVAASEASHMFFASPQGGGRVDRMFNFLATHPSLRDRIRKIDPTFKKKFPAHVKKTPNAQRLGEISVGEKLKKTGQSPFSQGKGDDVVSQLKAGNPLGFMQQLEAGIGQFDAGGLLVAAAMIDSIPPQLRQSAREPFAARGVIYALLLDEDMEIRKKQLDVLSSGPDQAVFRETLIRINQIDAMPEDAKLPLFELTFPALRSLSPTQYKDFRKNVETLAAADGKIDLFEYTMRVMLLRDLDVHFGKAKPVKIRNNSIASCSDSIVAVLGVLAYGGQSKRDEIEAAFKAGIEKVSLPNALPSKGECNLKTLDAALKELDASSPKVKQRVILACTTCILADGQVVPRELELLRAIVGAMGVPMPQLPVGDKEESSPGTPIS